MEKFAEKLASATPARQRAMLGNVHTLVGSNQLEKLEKYYRLLTNFDFMAAKVQHPDFGVQGLIEDYDLVGGNNEKVRTLKLIQGALRLSAHILVKDAKQLAGQLSARLQSFDVPEIKSLLQQISEAQNGCLISLTPSLSSPNGNLICTLSGHVDSVNTVAITPDGKFVVSGSSDHTVKKWDLNTATEVMTFRGHTSPVNAVAITPDGQKVVSGASDNTVRVWNLETGAEILTFNGHGLPIVAVGITLDGQKVVSASVANINSIKVWDVETGKEELTLKGHGDLVRAIAITRDEVISGGNSGIIKVWSLKNGKLLSMHNFYRLFQTLVFYQYLDFYQQPGGQTRVYGIATTVNDSQIVAVGSDNYLTGWNAKETSDNLPEATIKRLFNLNFWRGIKINQQIYQRKSFRRAFYRKLKSHNDQIVDIALTSDGTRFISASLDKTLKVWDAKSPKELLSLTGHNDSIHSVITSPDDKKLISASKDKTLKVWNLETVEKEKKEKKEKQVNHDLSVNKEKQVNHDLSVNEVIITPNIKEVFFCLQNNTVKSYNLENFEYIKNLQVDQNSNCLTNIKNNIFISTVGLFISRWDLILFFLITVWLISLPTGNLLFLFLIAEFIGSLFSSPYTFLAFLSMFILKTYFIKKANINIGSKELKYSDIKAPISTKVKQFKEEKNRLSTVAARLYNQELIFIKNINVIWNSYLLTVWSLEEDKNILDLLTPLQFFHLVVSRILFILIPTIISASFLSFLLLQQGILFLIFVIGICAMYIQIIIILYFNEFPSAISITSNEKLLISGSNKGNINIWDMEKKKLIFVLKGHQKEVTTLAITPDDQYLISGSDDKTIKIWNLKNQKECFTLKGHEDSVNTISITPDGKHLISGSKDKTIKIWHLENREKIFTFTGHTDSINSVKVTSDGQLVISASSDKTIQVWEFKTRKVIAKFTGESGINCCAVAPDNVTIVAGEEAGNIHFLRLQDFQVTVMNTSLQLNSQFQKIIREKTENYVDRPLISTIINNFLQNHNQGYFTLIGSPGSGKSAILANYTIQNPQTVYYSAEVEGKNRADEFLITLYTQLTQKIDNQNPVLPDNVTEGSWYLSLLLQKISDNLTAEEKLIIVVDGCDNLDPQSQPRDSNIFYLPRYLPKQVYFLLARRPFPRAKSGLLIETPGETLNLEQFPEQNQADARAYIQHYLAIPEVGANIKSWVAQNYQSEAEFCQQLAAESGNNFMYLSRVLTEFIPPNPSLEGQTWERGDGRRQNLPPSLEVYYQSLWEKMAGNSLSEIELGVLRVLVEQEEGVSTETIVQFIDTDEYDVEEVLETWLEFLHWQEIGGKICYSLYHRSYRNFLRSIE